MAKRSKVPPRRSPAAPKAPKVGAGELHTLFDFLRYAVSRFNAAKLVFAGIPERYPNIKWVLSHLGGAIPYLAERLDRGWDAFADCRADIPRKPSE